MADTVDQSERADKAGKVGEANTPPAEKAPPPSHKRALLISAVLASLLVIVGWYNDALMFAPFGLLALIWQIVCALGYMVLRRWHMLKRCGARMLIWLAAIAALMFIHDYYLKTTRTSAEAVLSALQAYRAREGRYPPNLEALAPRDMAVVPQWSMAPSRVQPFRYRLEGDKGENFDLRYFTGWRHQHVYESASGTWKLTD